MISVEPNTSIEVLEFDFLIDDFKEESYMDQHEEFIVKGYAFEYLEDYKMGTCKLISTLPTLNLICSKDVNLQVVDILTNALPIEEFEEFFMDKFEMI